MQCRVVLFCLTVVALPGLGAGELTAVESKALRAEIAALLEQFHAGNAAAFVDQTHVSLQRLMGGPGAFRKITQGALDQLLAIRVQVLEMNQGEPSETHVAGDEEVCFEPRTGILQIAGQHLRSTTFMIAIRKIGSDDWTFLEGAGLRDNPKMLPLLLPELDPGIALPPNRMEVLPAVDQHRPDD